MTRRDRDDRGSRGGRDAFDDDLYAPMRDAYEYLHGSRDAARDNGSSRREGPFGDTRDLLGLVAGGALVGLTAGLLGNANLGNTGIPMAVIPAAVGYAASYFDVLPSFSKDFRNAATGALVVGTGLWALAQGVRVQAARQAPGGGVVVAGSPPAYGPPSQMGAAPPMHPAHAAHPQAAQQYARVGACPPPAYGPFGPPPAPLPPPPFGAQMPMQQPNSRSPLSEAEMISIAQRY